MLIVTAVVYKTLRPDKVTSADKYNYCCVQSDISFTTFQTSSIHRIVTLTHFLSMSLENLASNIAAVKDGCLEHQDLISFICACIEIASAARSLRSLADIEVTIRLNGLGSWCCRDMFLGQYLA